MRAGRVILLTTAVVAVGAVGVATAATGSYSDGPLSATFSASTTHPNCKQLWPVTITARYNGRPAHATAKYQFLYNGQWVSTVYPFSGTRKNPHNRLWHFVGGFTDNGFGPFGALAVGHTLNVRAVIKDGKYTAYPGLYVTIRNASGCKARTS
jgi:hypothetical protein